jgi:hypothetical protein
MQATTNVLPEPPATLVSPARLGLLKKLAI